MNRALVAVIATALSLALFPATSAQADETPANPEIGYALAMVPGGTQTAANEVTWPDGTILTVQLAGRSVRAAAPACPSGSFCSFSGADGTGSRLAFSTCPSSNSVAALSQVQSISNARSTGTVTGRNDTTIVVTAAPGTTKAVTKLIDKLVCA